MKKIIKRTEVLVPENIEELRSEVAETLALTKAGHMKPHVAKEVVNASGKIINSIVMQIKLAEMMKEPPNIPYMIVPKMVEANKEE